MELDVKYKNRGWQGARPRAELRQAWLEVVKSDIEWVGSITSSLDLDAPRKKILGIGAYQRLPGAPPLDSSQD